MPAAAGSSRCHKCGGTLLETEDRALDMSHELTPGTELGSYRIVKLLGEGGMGRVYVAEHIRLGRRVAMKMLRQEFAANPVAVSRFFAEARAVNRISHEHLVEITDFFEKPGGENYFIMELLKGEDLGKLLLRGGALPVSRAVDIAHQTASVLAAVHAAGIVHRDLKPDNIFLVERASRPDFVKLLDFGVAKLSDAHGGIKLKTTSAGAVIGTPEYMSPEQAGGLPVDHRTDIYALGVIMYEFLSGRLPFQGKSFGEMVIKHMTVAPKPLGSYDDLKQPIPGALEDLVNALLEKNPDTRPQTMAEVEEVLQGLVDYVAETRRKGEMAVLKRPKSLTIDPIDLKGQRSRRVSITPVFGRETSDEGSGSGEATPSPAEAIPMTAPIAIADEPSASLAPGPAAVVSLPDATSFVNKPRVRLLAIVGCAMAAAALVTWLAMRGSNGEHAAASNASISDSSHALAPAAPTTAVAPTTPPPRVIDPPPPAAQPAAQSAVVAPTTPPTTAATTASTTATTTTPPHKATPPRPPHRSERPKQVDRSGTMDVFGDN
jgi:eukaryotic-like serine/threonine-protein kinase